MTIPSRSVFKTAFINFEAICQMDLHEYDAKSDGQRCRKESGEQTEHDANTTVDLAVVAATQGNCELVADLAAKCPTLAKAKMIGIAGLATANQAGMLGDVLDVVPNPARLRQCQNGPVDPSGSRPELGLRRPPGPFFRGPEPASASSRAGVGGAGNRAVHSGIAIPSSLGAPKPASLSRKASSRRWASAAARAPAAAPART